MKTHLLEITELYKLAGTSVEISSASRTADTAALTFLLDDVQQKAPWSFGDAVTLTENGEVVFYGYVTEEPDISIDAGGISCSTTLSNIVALVDATPYTDAQSFKDVVTNKTRLVSAKTTINKVLSHGMVLPGGGDATQEYSSIDISSTIMCPIGSGSQTCWSLVNSCLHWVPNAVSWYNPKTRTLSFRTAENGQALTLDLQAGNMRKGNEILFTFAGFESANFKARHDLQPPAVGLLWQENNKKQVFPDGGNLKQPWAFMFQIPERARVNDLDIDTEEKRAIQKAAQPTMLVLGRKVPDGWASSGDMMDEASGAPALWHSFWSSFSGMRPLAKTNVSCLRYGKAIFEPVPVKDAFPPTEDEEDTEQPENYHEFTDSDVSKNIYVLYQGQFPASSKGRDNVNGLKFCKGKLKQYVWVTSAYTGELSKKEWLEFFSGSTRIKINGVSGSARYVLLELDAVFINRRRKKFQTGTNTLSNGDDDWVSGDTPDDTPDDSDEATDSDYISAARDYYNATRKLYYDGSIALRGVNGYNPAMLAGANLNIVGARSEWGSMNTPVVRADWNPQYGTLTISTGSPEILSIDERIERTLLGRQSNNGSGTSFANPPITPPENPEEPETDEQEYPMISPSIAVNSSVTKSGRPLNPFELYSVGSKGNEQWFLNEGTLVAPGGKVIAFETTDVTEKVAENPSIKFSVRAERKWGSQEWEAVIRTFN